jgi:hypothetical protein
MPVLLYIGASILAHESPGHLDFFGEYHRNQQPVILCDGTSVKWPAGWTRKQVASWRKHHGLEKPKGRSKVS